MSDKLNLEGLSTKDISVLYEKTRQAVLKQRGTEQARTQAQEDLGFSETYWKDPFGNIIDGPRPKPKQNRHYVDSTGYVVELNDGEVAPDNLLAPGASGIERITHFVNAHLNDPDITALLPQEAHVVIAEYRNYQIYGRFDDGQWQIRAIDEVGDQPDILFRMPGSLDQDQAAVHARNYVQNQLALRLRELSQTDVNFIQRIATSNRDWAVALYLKSRLPSRYEKELNRLATEIEQTGNTLELLRFMSNPDVNSVAEEAVFNV